MIHIENLSVTKLEQLLNLRQKMANLEGKIQDILSGTKRTHHVSPEGRKRMSQGMKRWWAQRKGKAA